MSERSWQYFRDLASHNENSPLVKYLIHVLRFDLTCYLFGQLGISKEELNKELRESPESRELVREIWATLKYLNQFEEESVVRDWFIATNPSYDDISPADLFRGGQREIVINHLKSGGSIFASLSA